MTRLAEFLIFFTLWSACLIVYFLKVRQLDKKIKEEFSMTYKHATLEDDYLVVCPTKKQAMYWRRRLLDNISGCYTKDEIKVINNYGKYICLYFTRLHLSVRFVSEADYFEVSRGFRGWVVEQYQLEDWIRAAETNSVA